MAQEQDPFARFRVGAPPKPTIDPANDPFARFRAGTNISTPEVIEEEEPEVVAPPIEEPNPLMDLWNLSTTSILPASQPRVYNDENTMPPFFDRAIDEIGRGVYEDVIRPSASAFGVATSLASGPIIRGALRVASRIPGAEVVKKILTTPLFGKAAQAVPEETVAPAAISQLPEVRPNPVHGGMTTEPIVERMPGGPNIGMYGIKPEYSTVPDRLRGPSTNQTVFDTLLPSRTKELINQRVKVPEPGMPASSVEVPKIIERSDGSVSMVTNPATRLEPTTGQPLPGPIDKFINAAKEAKKLGAQQAAIYTAEKAEKVAKAKAVETTGQKGFFERLGSLKGEHTKVQMEPLNIDQADVNMLFDDIHISGLDTFQEINASKGLQKMLDGRVPQRSELNLLKQVFGADKIDELEKALPQVDARKDMFRELINIPRGMQTIYDLSFPFRQGLGSIATKAWWTSWDDMVKSLGSEKAYRGVIDSIMEHPNFQPTINELGKKEAPLFKQAGLRITDLTDATRADGELASNLVEKYVPGAKASNRAYVAFANKLRADNFNTMIAAAEKAGKNPRENLELARQIAGMINNTSGAGNLGIFEKHAALLSDMLFSPRFIASRLQMVNPANYIKTDPMVRKQYLKSLLALTTAWGTSLKLAELAGGEVGTDPNSTDFGKAKFGDTRLDPGAGFQQYLVLASRLSNGQYSTVNNNTREYGQGFGSKTKFDALMDFVVNKLAPAPSYLARAARATEYRPFELADETTRLFTPMVIQDLSDILQDDPTLLPLMVPALVGYGVQAQGERGGNTRLFGNEIPDIRLEGNEGFGFGPANPFQQRMRQ